MDLVASYPHDFQSCYLFQYSMGFHFPVLIKIPYGTLGKDRLPISFDTPELISAKSTWRSVNVIGTNS